MFKPGAKLLRKATSRVPDNINIKGVSRDGTKFLTQQLSDVGSGSHLSWVFTQEGTLILNTEQLWEKALKMFGI